MDRNTIHFVSLIRGLESGLRRPVSMPNSRFAPLRQPPGSGWNGPPEDDLEAVRDKYLHDWQIVKRARFNASKRYERKQGASTLAFASAGTIGFVVPFFTTLFKSALEPYTINIMDFVSYITGALSVSIGLVEQAKNYPIVSKSFHTCGLEVNGVLRRLRAQTRPTFEQLETIVLDYERALERCELNHDEIDSNIAYAQDDVANVRALSKNNPKLFDKIERLEGKLRTLRWKELIQIYWLYWAVWLLPTVGGIAIWWALPAPPGFPYPLAK